MLQFCLSFQQELLSCIMFVTLQNLLLKFDEINASIEDVQSACEREVMLTDLDTVRQQVCPQPVLRLVHTANTDMTRLSCLVLLVSAVCSQPVLGLVHTADTDTTRLSCLVLLVSAVCSQPVLWPVHTADTDTTRLSCLVLSVSAVCPQPALHCVTKNPDCHSLTLPSHRSFCQQTLRPSQLPMFMYFLRRLVSLHMCCIIVTRWGVSGKIEA